jgi:hypothetical protein
MSRFLMVHLTQRVELHRIDLFQYVVTGRNSTLFLHLWAASPIFKGRILVILRELLV